MLRDLFARRVSPIIEMSIFLVLTLILVYVHSWSHPRDAGAYIQGGIQILNGENPYLEGIFRGGAFGSVIAALLLGYLPLVLQSLILLFFSCLGVWLFSRIFLSSKPANVFLCACLLLSSSNRTSLDTIQLTGLIMGLVYLLNKYILQRNNFSWVSFTLVSFASAVFLDLKPHILIPFIALTFLHKMNFRYIVATGLIWGIGHLVVGLLFGFSHVKNWVILILEIGESQNFENFDGAAHNYWQLVTYYLKSDIKFVQFIPFFLYFVSLLVSCLIIRKVSFLGLCALAMTCIGFSSYSHFYDFIPLVAISLVALHREKYSSFENFFLLFVILPQNWSIPQNVIFVILTSVAYSTFRCLDDVSSNGQNQRQIIFRIIYTNFIGLLLYFSLQIFNFYLPLPEKLIDAVTTSELLILFLAILGRKGFRSLKVSFNA